MAPAEFNFPKEARLSRPEEFKRALRCRPVARSDLFFCHFVRNERCDDLGKLRLGLIIPKRFAKRATTRNAIKRVLREAFRLKRFSLPSGDLVIRLKSTAPTSSLHVLKSLVRSDIDAIFYRMGCQQ